MTQEELKKLLKRYGLEPNKTFGQNFLLDERVLENIIVSSKLSKEDMVLEVGPGIGNLTTLLAEKAGRVLCVEKDVRFKPILSALCKKHKNVQVVYADILNLDFVSALQKLHMGREKFEYKVVANLPYYLTGAAFQLFLRQASMRPKSITVLIQKEVAENVVALPGKTNLLSLSVQLLGTPSIVQVVSRESFYPAPKVTSCVLKIDIPSTPIYLGLDNEELFFRVARSCFSGKRKQIHNSLASGLNLSQEKTMTILKRAKIAPDERPQRLSVQEFINLSKAVMAVD